MTQSVEAKFMQNTQVMSPEALSAIGECNGYRRD
jgi:hypothetical protein